MFDLLRKISKDPIQDQLKLWDTVIFHYLIGNTDGHIKNFSLLYGPDLRSVRLAPSYDILSTVIYEASTRHMALRIGNTLDLDAITRGTFLRAADDVGLGSRLAMQRFDDLTQRFEDALDHSAARLLQSGFLKAEELARQIREKGGIAKQIYT